MSREYPDAIDEVTARLIDAVNFDPSEARSAIVDVRRGRDWATAALNSPVGQIALAILQDSRLEQVEGDVDPSANWLAKLERLLNLTGDPRRHAVAIISHNLGWLHRVVREWTERHLLSILDGGDIDDQAALWAGFFWNPRVSSVDLYLRLKPALLALAKQRDSSREAYLQSLAYLILLGWAATFTMTGAPAVSNDELRDVLLLGGEEFRSHVIWQFQRELANDQLVARAQELFSHVWPRQRSVKTPTMSIGLVELLVSNVEAFPGLAELVLPLLTKIDQPHGHYFADKVKVDAIIDKYSDPFLGVLHAVLPDKVINWPYGIGDLLEKIGDANSDLLADPRLQELKRKWSAR